MEADLPERKLILPWLPEGGLAMVYAERGLGKTHFALSLATSVANGSNFLKWTVQEPCGVLFVDGEMSLTTIRDRLRNFAPTSPTQLLNILSHEWFFKQFECDLSITDSLLQEKLLEELDKNPSIKVVIVDNLSSLSRIREDKADDWRAHVLPFLIKCRRRGVSVVLIHHTGKSGDQRGTGAREDQLDTSIKLERVADSTPEKGCQFKVSFTKSRGCFGEDVVPFIATLLEKSEKEKYWEINTINESTKGRLIELIADCGEEGISGNEAAQALGVSKGLISRLKKELEKEAVIQYSTGKKSMVIAYNWKGR